MWQVASGRCSWLRADLAVRGASLVLVLGWALIACTPAAAPTPSPQPSSPTSVPATLTSQPSPAPETTQPAPDPYGLQFEVVAWLSNERPRLGERIILIASLAVNGGLTSGEWLRATWPDSSAPGGRKLCRDTPSYARGVCYITVGEQYPAGQPVPITIDLLRQGTWHRGEISFTPQ